MFVGREDKQSNAAGLFIFVRAPYVACGWCFRFGALVALMVVMT